MHERGGDRRLDLTHWNDDPQPFVWTKTVDDIITKVKRGRAALDHVTESATQVLATVLARGTCLSRAAASVACR